jgi:hypothetical protein
VFEEFPDMRLGAAIVTRFAILAINDKWYDKVFLKRLAP